MNTLFCMKSVTYTYYEIGNGSLVPTPRSPWKAGGLPGACLLHAVCKHWQLLVLMLTKCKHLYFPAATNWFGNIYVSVYFKAKNSAGMFKSNSIVAVRNAPVILKVLLKMFTFLKTVVIKLVCCESHICCVPCCDKRGKGQVS